MKTRVAAGLATVVAVTTMAAAAYAASAHPQATVPPGHMVRACTEHMARMQTMHQSMGATHDAMGGDGMMHGAGMMGGGAGMMGGREMQPNASGGWTDGHAGHHPASTPGGEQ